MINAKMTLTFDKDVYAKLLAEVQPKVITTQEENEIYLEIVEKLIACKNCTLEQNALVKLLVTLIEEFEEQHYKLYL